ncbi:uncharacterized membrane protein (DUF485 family) [Peribacillus deserti]|uniref:Uncharacterized membrane protein (DUF485 family) n=1 Tax=Peribacillus deserti TaxID=673318 RepID=A0ABS2QKU6_9BACI|nr:hypothetical protein [Peribacillus deserti]MBM7693798.1 uncharacterized membrane protein (DUF485 family) [Peribacillus deserti]
MQPKSQFEMQKKVTGVKEKQSFSELKNPNTLAHILAAACLVFYMSYPFSSIKGRTK